MKWDKGIDYERVSQKLKEDYLREIEPKTKTKIAILLIQLRNGLRITEAIEAMQKFSETGEREVEVQVKKKKKEELRKAIIPEFIERAEKIPTRDAVIKFAERTYGFNTHSLRYAFITHLAEKGVSPQLIAKITKHSKLDMLLEYTQEKKAEKLLREL